MRRLAVVVDISTPLGMDTKLRGYGLGDSHFLKWVMRNPEFTSEVLFVHLDDISSYTSNDELVFIYPVGLYVYPNNVAKRWATLAKESSEFRSMIETLTRIPELYLLLDHSYESLMPDDLRVMPSVLKTLGFPLERVVIFTGHPCASTMSAILSDFGVVIAGDYFWEYYYRFLSNHSLAGAQRATLIKRRAIFDPTYRPLKLFTSLNRRPRFHRIALVATLIDTGLADQGYMSFGGLDLEWGSARSANEILFAKLLMGESLTSKKKADLAISELIKMGPINLDADFGEKPNSHQLAESIDDELESFYQHSFFSIVAETNFGDNSFDHFATEKLLRAIAFGHPFIHVGPPGVLELLRDRGYKTFAPLINEDYDLICHPASRFQSLISSIADLTHSIHKQGSSIMSPLLDIALHNQQNFIFGTSDRVRTFLRRIPGIIKGSRVAAYHGEQLAEYDSHETVDVNERAFIKVQMNTSQSVHFVNGFYAFEAPSNGRWSSAAGCVRLFLHKGNWCAAFHVRANLNEADVFTFVDGVRVNTSVQTIAGERYLLVDFPVACSSTDIQFQSRCVFCPAGVDLINGDQRILGVWFYDDVLLHRFPAEN